MRDSSFPSYQISLDIAAPVQLHISKLHPLCYCCHVCNTTGCTGYRTAAQQLTSAGMTAVVLAQLADVAGYQLSYQRLDKVYRLIYLHYCIYICHLSTYVLSICSIESSSYIFTCPHDYFLHVAVTMLLHQQSTHLY